MPSLHDDLTMPEEAIDLIAQRVIDALRDDLQAVAAELAAPAQPSEQHLTVGQVAQRLGVARSTVYSHWRQWGGYKLGPGPKAPIRFDSRALPIVRQDRHQTPPQDAQRAPSRRRRRRPRRNLLADAPRLVEPTDEIG
jgi:hypothetical protein